MSSYRDMYCPHCKRKTYFNDKNQCQVCKFTFLNTEFESGIESYHRLNKDEFLCDSCKYDNIRYCHSKNFPRAIACVDYEKR